MGFLATYAWWGWKLYALTGNPFFPYFNSVFHSSWLAPTDFVDARFQVHGLGGVLMAPFELLQASLKFSELRLRDPRLLLGLLGLGGLVIRPNQAAPFVQQRLRMLLVFFVVSYVLWALQYGIYRYALSLELLGGLALVLCLHRLPGRVAGLALLASVLLVNLATHRQNWGHVHDSRPRYGIARAPLPQDAMVLIADGEPVAYLALGLPASTPMIALGNNILSPQDCSLLQQRARAAVAAHAGSLWLLSATEASAARGAALLRANYQLAASGECREFPNSLGAARLCPLRRLSPTPSCGE